MIGMLFEINVDNILSLDNKHVIKEIKFESSDKIDDLFIKTNSSQKI